MLHKDNGSSIILDTFSTAQNGHWAAQSGHAWSDITVNVPGSTTITSLSVTANGTYTAPANTAYTPVTVNVPQPTLTTLNANENRTYTAPANTAYNVVNVNVPTYEEEYREMVVCSQEVIARLQKYDPDFDPQTCEDIPPKIDEVAGYEPPNKPTHGDVVDALVPLGGGDVDTVGTGTAGNYTYRIEFAGFARDAYAMLNPITGQPINDIITSTLWADFTPGEWHAGDGGRIYPVIKITIDGVGWGYANAPGFLNGGSGWSIICDSEWKFGIADITAYNDGAGNRVITTFYPASAGWADYGVYFSSNTVTKDSVTTKVYTKQ